MTYSNKKLAVELAEPKILVCSLMLNAEEFVQPWIRQAKYIAGSNGRIVVTEGAVAPETDGGFGLKDQKSIGRWHTPDGHSVDRTLEILEADSAVHVVKRNGYWESKFEMTTVQEPLYKGFDYLWIIAADEFFPRESIDYIKHNLKTVQPGACELPMYQIFGSMFHYVQAPVGEWGMIPVHRIFKLEDGARWKTHRPNVVVNAAGQDVREINPTTAQYLSTIPLFKMHHYSYVLKDQLEFKAEYYRQYYPEKAKLITERDLNKAIKAVSPNAHMERLHSIPEWWYCK